MVAGATALMVKQNGSAAAGDLRERDRSGALVRPFAGYRFADRDRLSDLLAPPYDVITPPDRERLATRHPENIVHYILPHGGDDRYVQAASTLRDWIANRVLELDREPAVTVLRETFTAPDGRMVSRGGVIAGVAVEPFSTGRVKPHERTHRGPKADRLALLRATGAMYEALLMLARDPTGDLRTLIGEATTKRPWGTARVQEAEVAIWRVTGTDAQALAGAAGSGALYLADGHHRYETAVTYFGEHPAADLIPGYVVPLEDPGLLVRPTHRVLYGTPVDARSQIPHLRERFQLRELPPEAHYEEDLAQLGSRGTACVLVLPGGQALALLLKSGARLGDLSFAGEPSVAALDVARVDELIVKRLAAAMGEGNRLEYASDAAFVIDEVRTGRAACGVLVNATPVDAVLAVADAGAVMPQKSTFFTPKVPSGVVGIHYTT